LTTESLKSCIKEISKAFSAAVKQNFAVSDDDCVKLAASLCHDLIFQNEKRKSTFQKEEESVDIEVEDIEQLLLSYSKVSDTFAQAAIRQQNFTFTSPNYVS